MIPDRYTDVSGSDPGPVDGVLALLDALLGRPTLIVEGCGPFEDALIYGALGNSDLVFTPQAGMNAQNHYG
jgi:hypothetical protein